LSHHDLCSSITLFYQAREGDQASLDHLYRRYLPRLSRWATGRLPAKARDLQETGDLVQEALLAFLGRMEGFEPRHDGSLMAYLCLAIMNRIRDAYRGANRRPARTDVDSDELAHSDQSPYELCVDAETRRRYAAALERLNEDDRTAVVLKVELAYGPTEIAQAMNKSSPDAARMFTQRAISKLAKEMGRD